MDTKHPENLGHPEITKITETEEAEGIQVKGTENI